MLKKTLFLSWLLLLSPMARADEASIYIDPSDSTRILRTAIPFVPEVVLSASELPPSSHIHAPVPFNEQKFTYLAVSPDGSRIAFSVDADTHDWTGVHSLAARGVEQLTLCFESQALRPYWSTDGRYLVVEEAGAQDKRQLRVFDMVESTECVLDGVRLKNKFLNLSDPWWSGDGSEVFFKVENNDAYRRSVGLKALNTPAKIGESSWDCKKIAAHPVARFLADHPAEAPPEQVLSSLVTEAPVTP